MGRYRIAGIVLIILALAVALLLSPLSPLRTALLTIRVLAGLTLVIFG